MREVVLKLTTQKDLIKHQSAASTFGELKQEMKQVKWNGMRVVERASKATLQMDDAVLPQGDFLLFLVPEKVKSGRKTSGGTEKLSGPIEDCKYNELRSHMSWLNREKDAGLDVSGGTADLQKELKKYYKKNPAGKSSGKKPAAKPAAKKPAAKPAAKEAAPKANKYKPSKKQDDEDDEDYADRIAYEEKAFNKKEKKRLAKLEEERKAKEAADKKAAEEKAAGEKRAAEKKAAQKKPEKRGIFGKKKATPKPADPIETIEDARQMINMAVDEIVQGVIQGGGGVPTVLTYTAAELEKEAKDIHRKLRTSRSQAKYID